MESLTLSTDEIAEALGVTPRRVRQVAHEAGVAPAAHGLWPFAPIAAHVIARLKDGQPSRADPSRERLVEAKAAEIEARIAARRAELIPRSDAEAVMENVCRMLADAVAGLGDRVSSNPKVAAEVDKEIADVLRQINRQREKVVEAITAGIPQEEW